jgi:cysteine sulfinate desulfinase/cysteine desulfurase-like protein
MGYAPGEARRVIRISAGWETTGEDWERLAEAMHQVEARLRASSSPDVIEA